MRQASALKIRQESQKKIQEEYKDRVRGKNINGVLIGQYLPEAVEEELKAHHERLSDPRELYSNFQLKTSPLNPLSMASRKKAPQEKQVKILSQYPELSNRFPELDPTERNRINSSIKKENKVFRLNPKDGSIIDLRSSKNSLESQKSLNRYKKLYGVEIRQSQEPLKNQELSEPLKELNKLFDQVVIEIEERQSWLTEMEELVKRDNGRDLDGLKKTRENLVRVKDEIVERVSELEKIVHLIKKERIKNANQENN